MINSCTVIITDSSSFTFVPDQLEEIHIAFELKNELFFEKVNLEMLHEWELLLNPKLNFSIYIDTVHPGVNLKAIATYLRFNKDILLQFFFHLRYKRIEQQPVFCFKITDHILPEVQEFIKDLEKLVFTQGYVGIKPIYFSNKINQILPNSTVQVSYPPNISLNDISQLYYIQLHEWFFTAGYLGIESVEFYKVINTLMATEQQFQKDYPLQYEFLLYLKKLKRNNQKLNEDLRLTKIDLENQRTYLKIIKDQDEANKINNFYHTEYEILPLWYKRFGHLLKIITGKRTFRSLFDKNAKKYKN